jgi:hypothetical protein
MEPLIDKLARQSIVKNSIAAIRNGDRNLDKWALSKPIKWRVFGLVGIPCLLPLVIVFGLVAAVILYCFSYALLLPNFCLIAVAKRSAVFKGVNFGIFALYSGPLAAELFYSDKFFGYFPGAIFLFPLAMLFHFYYLIFAWRRIQRSSAWKTVKFVIAMLVMCIICAFVWDDVVMENLYNDTDENMFGFLSPGGWVSDWDGQHPIVQVDHIVHGGPMGDPDTIKKGWTVADLWLLWFGFIGVSAVISVGAARFSWTPKCISAPS